MRISVPGEYWAERIGDMTSITFHNMLSRFRTLPLEDMKRGCWYKIVWDGTPDELDDKLGRLLYVSQTLLKQELAHELHCLTGDGVKICAIADETTLNAAMAELLCARPASEGDAPSVQASWQYHIGGEPDAT